MFNMRCDLKIRILFFCRYFTLLIVIFYGFSLNAQNDISQRLNHILVSKDIEACKKIMQQITDADISQMSDTTLLEYYYLAAWNAYENNQMKEKIDYLLKVKTLCENKLGIHNQPFIYFEILKALGETYEELGKDDEALLWYEEGLVKGISYLQTTNKTLNGYFKEIRNNAANILEKKGHIEMANYLKLPQPLNYAGSFDYACDLLSQAIDLHNSGKNHDAISLLNDANEIFKLCGKDGEEMESLLYRRYLICYAGIGDTIQVNNLLHTKKQLMFQGEDKSFFIDDLTEVIACFLTIHYDVDTSLKYYNYLVEEYDRSEQKNIVEVESLGKNLNFYVNTYAQIDSLENIRSSHISKDYEWGVTSLFLANNFIRLERYDEANNICNDIYSMSYRLDEDPQNLHWFVLMNLADYNIFKKDKVNAERYLTEQLSWLDSHNFPVNVEERGWVYNKLGIVYMNGSNYEESNKMLLIAEKILLAIYEKDSSAYATILHNRGRLAQLQGKLDEAKELLKEALRIQETVEGKANDRTIQYLNEVEQAIKVRL